MDTDVEKFINFLKKGLSEIDIAESKKISQFMFQDKATLSKGGGSHQVIQCHPDVFPVHYLFAKTNRNVPERDIDPVTIRRTWERLTLMQMALEKSAT